MSWVVFDKTKKGCAPYLASMFSQNDKNFVVGFTLGGGVFVQYKEVESAEEAEQLVHYLNGGN